MLKVIYKLKIIQQLEPIFHRNFSISGKCLLDRKWRQEKGLPENPNSFGPLTNLPDYTFMDGRPTPMASRLKNRLSKQQEITKKIVQFNKELNYAKERYNRLQENKKLEKENILKSKLKPKGHLLCKE